MPPLREKAGGPEPSGPSLQPQGELVALRGGDVAAQPLDQQDPGGSAAGPAEPGDAEGVGSWQQAPVEEEARTPTGCQGVRSQPQASSLH